MPAGQSFDVMFAESLVVIQQQVIVCTVPGIIAFIQGVRIGSLVGIVLDEFLEISIVLHIIYIRTCCRKGQAIQNLIIQ